MSRTPRVYVPEPMSPGQELELPKAAAHHVVDVLRLKIGSALELFNGDAHHYAATLLSADKHARIHITDARPSSHESPLQICLWQGLSRGERMDASVRQSVELGATAIKPVQTTYSQVKLDAKRAAKRHAHWSSIIISAAEQCGRATLAELAPLMDVAQALSARDPERLGIVLDPSAERSLGGYTPPQDLQQLDVLIGPESGLSEHEIALAEQAGFLRLSAGQRILRTETAGPAALAILQARFGDLT